MMRAKNNASGYTRSADGGIATSSSRPNGVASGATANTKGSFINASIAISDATPNAELVIVTFTSPSASADFLVDLAWAANGTDTPTIFAENIRVPFLKSANEGGFSIALPVHIPFQANTTWTFRTRAQSSVANATVDVAYNFSTVGVMGAPGCARVIPLFTPPASTSRGVALDAGATLNTLPAYTQLVASTTGRICGVFAIIGNNADITRTLAHYLLNVAVGAAGQEQAFIQHFPLCCSTAADTVEPRCTPVFPVDIPAGSRIAARIQADNVTAGDRTVDVSLYGLVR